MAKTIFWLSFALVAYVYAGYPLLLLLWSRLRPRPVRRAADAWEPRVSLILAAHNERRTLERKIRNCLALDYPPEKLQVVVSLDGSTDGSAAVAEASRRLHAGLTVIEGSHRGKASAINRGVAAATGEVLVFCDARQRIEPGALRALLADLGDPAVGAVTGELLLLDDSAREAVDGVGLYWRYEKALRAMESTVHSTLGVTGALYALRRELFVPLPEQTILDDMMVPLRAVLGGRRTVFEPRARAYDGVCPPDQEFRRKLRTLVGNFQLLRAMPELLDPGRNPVFVQFVSHKLGRLVVPYALVALLVSNLALHSGWYLAFLGCQCAWYLLAAGGALLSRRPTETRAPFETASPSAPPTGGALRSAAAAIDFLPEGECPR
jgi:cellulose synthase/poly-beta-1,6-N-acetylglucosamine synthase-like glycosyltransferase